MPIARKGDLGKLPSEVARPLPFVKLIEEGIEHQPGPSKHEGGKDARHTIVEFMNVTHAENNFDFISSRRAHALFLNEHAVSDDRRDAVKARFGAKQWQACTGPADQMAGKTCGGVACAMKRPRRNIKIRIKTEEFRMHYGSGRLMIHGLGLGPNQMALVITMYGHTGAHQRRTVADLSDEMFAAILEELRHHPRLPTFIMGDINGEAEDFATLQAMLKEQDWHDLGAEAARLWQSGISVHMCWPPCQGRHQKGLHVL